MSADTADLAAEGPNGPVGTSERPSDQDKPQAASPNGPPVFEPYPGLNEWVEAALEACVAQGFTIAIEDPSTLDFLAEVLAHPGNDIADRTATEPDR